MLAAVYNAGKPSVDVKILRYSPGISRVAKMCLLKTVIGSDRQVTAFVVAVFFFHRRVITP